MSLLKNISKTFEIISVNFDFFRRQIEELSHSNFSLPCICVFVGMTPISGKNVDHFFLKFRSVENMLIHKVYW